MTSWSRPRGGQPLAQRLAGRHLAEAQDEVGRRPAGRSAPSDHLVGGDHHGSGRGDRSEAARSARRGSGCPAARARSASGSRSPGSVWRPATIRPRSDVAEVLGELVESEIVGVGRNGCDRGQRPALAALQRQRVGRGDCARLLHRRQRLAPGEVEVDRARPGVAAGGSEGPAGDRAVVEEAGVVGLVVADLAEPADRVAVELQLVDRLTGADPAQLRRAVRGEGDQPHGGLVRLADRGVEVGGGGPRGAEHRHRRPARLGGAEGEEGGRALVDDHAQLDRGLAVKRHRQRGRARAGGEDRVAHPAAGQLLDQGRGERGVAIGRVHRAD